MAGSGLAVLCEAIQRGFERGVLQLPPQFLKRGSGFPVQLALGGPGLGGLGCDLHPDLNSSNLASPCLKKGNQFGGHLPKFGCHCAVVCGNDKKLLTHLKDTADIAQRGRYDGLVDPLQG